MSVVMAVNNNSNDEHDDKPLLNDQNRLGPFFTKHFLYIISFDSLNNPIKLMLSLSRSWRKGN